MLQKSWDMFFQEKQKNLRALRSTPNAWKTTKIDNILKLHAPKILGRDFQKEKTTAGVTEHIKTLEIHQKRMIMY